MTKPAISVRDQEEDADLRAVRQVIVESRRDAVADAGPAQALQELTRKRQRLPLVPTVQTESSAALCNSRNAVGRALVKQWRAKAVARAKAYQPDRTSVFVTSLVLLTLLHPAIVLTTLLFGILTIAMAFAVLGSDGFWQRAFGVFRIWERVRPRAARRFRLRTFALCRKWESKRSRLPRVIGDRLAPPDFRALLAADANHDAVLANRLQRLQQDGTR